MTILIDTSVLARWANPTDKQHGIADQAVSRITHRGDDLVLTPQVLVEFRAVATRPTANNGLGYSAAQAEKLVTGYERLFPLLVETPAIYPTWKTIVSALGVVGKTVHDARLVAVCFVYRVTHLLTFNLSHFQTLAAAPPGLVVLDPATA
jgi:predicted nucleic acid-binding protein